MEFIRSFSLFTFFSPSPATGDAFAPGTCEPVALESAASAIAAFVSFETAGGCPVTGPVLSPTTDNFSQLQNLEFLQH